MRIDAHHHFWRYDAVEYGWIDDSMQRIRRDFLPADLQRELQNAGMNGVVTVQARQSLFETEWLLGLADEHTFIQGIVGWVPLVSSKLEEILERLTVHPKLRAVRHVVQSEPDGFLLKKEFNQGVALLQKYGLVYDLLIFEHQLPEAVSFVDRHPNQVFVLDHIAKPKIGEDQLEPWKTHLAELALRQNVFCKVSGMVTEAKSHDWTAEQLKPYWQTVLDAFGPNRLMFGSDWPVCLLACDYVRWFETVRCLAKQLSESDQERLFGLTACEAYSLKN